MEAADILKNLGKIENEINEALTQAKNLEELNDANLKYIAGKNSPLNTGTAALASLPKEDKKLYGPKINELKQKITSLYEQRKEELLNTSDTAVDWYDVTLPPQKPKIGHLSIDTQIIRKLNEYFIYNGFSIAEGPDIETETYNFEKTNLPKDHPARDLQDTIYIESPEILLRTHTSNVETRILTEKAAKNELPVRFVVPGAVFRNEILSPSNHAIFQQYQGVMVDKGVSMANLKAILDGAAKHLYGKETKTRFRCKYYPEVEPGMGMDISCKFCDGKGCTFCKNRGWLEALGCGMIHRNMMEKCGIDYKEWSGFAFGMGLDRLIATAYDIDDLRDLHGGNLVIED